MVGIWAVRLGLFLFRRVKKSGKDTRFDEIKLSFSRFLMSWTLQGLWVLLTAAAALSAITAPHNPDLNIIDYLGISMWIIGFGIEVVADSQKTKFRGITTNKGKFITEGLWAHSRHPNYFGEIVLWFGVAIIASSALQGWAYISLISPVFVFVLLTKISGIPLLEIQAQERWGNDPKYQEYLRNTPALIPKLKR